MPSAPVPSAAPAPAPTSPASRRRRLTAAFAVAATTASVLSVATLAAVPARAATAFTPDDVVVDRVGTGASTLTSAATASFLDEFSPTGGAVQSIALPTAASGADKALTNSGTASSEGVLTLSPNGRFLTATGYNAVPGTSSVAGTTSASVSRTVAIVGANGAVDTSTSLTDAFSGNNIRSAVTADGSAAWAVGGNSGVRYAVKGASTSTQVSDTATGAPSNFRQVQVAGGQLVVSASSATPRVATVGSGVPVTGPQTVTNLPGAISASATAPYQVAFLALGSGTTPDTAYVADNTAGAVQKYSLVGGTWNATGSVSGLTGVTGVAANGYAGTVRLYATTPTGLFRVGDASGAGGTLTGAPGTAIATAPANTAFRGVSFAPGTTISGGTGAAPPAVGAPTVTVAQPALAAALGDPTNPTLGATVAVGTNATYAAGRLTVSASSSDTTVAPNNGISVSGAGADRTLTVTPGAVGTATITLTVTAPDGQSGTTAFTYAVSADQGDASDRYLAGAGNASAVVDVGGGYALVGDDESDVIRLYDTSRSGLPVATFDFTAQLPFGNAEVDIEGAARAGDTVYWMGSMSTNSSGKVAPARSTLFATRVSGSGANTTLGYVGANTDLQTDLVRWDVDNGHGLGANHFGFDRSVNGGIANHATDSFNLEGLEFAAGSTTTAYLAFRAPIVPASDRTRALLVPVTNFTELVEGNAVHGSFGPPIQWDLGGLGVRDLKANADGTFVVIAGTADGTNSRFVLYTWDGDPNDPPLAGTSLPLVPAAPNQGAWEAVVSVPSPLTAGSPIPLVEDDGDLAWYGNGQTSKAGLAVPLQKDLLRTVSYAAPAPVATVTTLGATPNPARVAQPVTATATVTADRGTPRGTVAFTAAGAPVAGCDAVALGADGTADCTTSYPHAGSQQLVATYSGAAAFGSSTSDPLTLTVQPTPVTVTADDQTIGFGSPEPTYTFTATPAVTFATSPTCSVAGTHTAVGTYPIVCSGGDAGSDHTITYVDGTLTVTPAATTVTVTADPTSPTAGEAVSFTATVDAGGRGTATGTVGFTLGGTALAGCDAVAVDGAGAATCAVPGGFLPGDVTVTATYSGDASFGGSSDAVTVTVGRGASVTTVTVSPATPLVGEAVTLTATVTGPNGITPSGSVTFAVDGGPTGCADVALDGSGRTSCVVPDGYAAGDHTVVATYSGDGTVVASNDSAAFTVVRATSAIVVSVDPSNPVTGQPLTVTATVSGSGPRTPTGTVMFTVDGGAGCGSAALDAAGRATCTLTGGLRAGSHTVGTSFSGDAANASATASTDLTVGAAATSTSLTTDVATPVSGQAVTFSATVSVPAPGAGSPTGTVSFSASDGRALPGCESPVDVDRAGTAQCTVAVGFTPGSFTVVAVYSGDDGFAASSDSRAVAVAKASVGVAVTAAPDPPTAGSATTFRAVVSAVAPGTGTPTGTAAFTVTTGPGNTRVACSGGSAVALAGGAANCVVPAGRLAAGATFTVSVAYAGDARFAVGGGTFAQTVARIDTTTTVTSVPNPAASGAAVKLTARVSPVSGAARPTGSVTFTLTGVDGTQVACATSNTLTLSAGAATCSVAPGGLRAASGPYTVTVVYSGSTAWSPSRATFTQQVRRAVARVVLTQSAAASPQGSSATFTATVTPAGTGAIAPTGSVAFSAADRFGGAVTCAGGGPIAADGTVSCTIAGSDLLVAGSPYRVTATYSGDADYAAGTAVASHRVTRR